MLKRLVGVVITLIILYAIYYDLSQGTLPASMTKEIPVSKTSTDSESPKENDLPYFERKVKSGDTVLSILEEHLNHSISVPITEVVADFKELNDGISPQEIQQGKVYKFPNYPKERES